MNHNDPDGLRGEGVRVALDELPDGSVVAAGGWSGDREDFFGPTVLDASTRADLAGRLSTATSSQTDFDLGFEQLTDFVNEMPATVDRKAVVFLSDGDDNDNEWFADQALADQGIPVYTIGLGASANDTALTSIAEAAGRTGKYYKAQTVADVQAAFADITNAQLCRTQKAAGSATLKPGESRVFPFKVQSTDRGWQAVASWDQGDFAVSVVRPNGSAFNDMSTTRLPDETYDASRLGAKRLTLGSNKPETGDWSVIVTAKTTNAGAVNVDIRVYNRHDGGAVLGVDGFADKPLDFTIPRIRAGVKGLRKIGGIPIHLYVQPTVGLGSKYSGARPRLLDPPVNDVGGEQVYTVFAPAAPKAPGSSPAGPLDRLDNWTFSVADFGWKGPGIKEGPFNVEGPQLDDVSKIANSIVTEYRDDKGRKVDKNKSPDEALFVVTLGRLGKAYYTQEFPVPSPYYLALVVHAELIAKVAAPLLEFTAWAAERLALEEAGALTFGFADIPITAAITASTSVQLVQEGVELVRFADKVLKINTDVNKLVEGVKGTVKLFVEQVKPRIKKKVKEVVNHATKAVGHTVRAGVNHVAGGGNKLLRILSIRAAAVANASSAAYARPRPLTVRPLRGRQRLRYSEPNRHRVDAAIRIVNRYAPTSPVSARALLVSGPRRAGAKLNVAAKFPGFKRSRQEGLTVLSLVGPAGVAYEKLLRVSHGISGATVLLPHRTARGRWRIAISDLSQLQRPKGRVQIALTEFVIHKGPKPAKTPTTHPTPTSSAAPPQTPAPLPEQPIPAINTLPAPIPPEWIRTGYGARRCLDADLNMIGANRTKVQVWDCNGAPQQHWVYNRADHSLQTRASAARCLDADLNTIGSNGGGVQLSDCNGQPQQQWSLEPNGSIRTMHTSRKCLELDISTQGENSAEAQLSTCNSSVQQRWTR